MPSVKRRPDDLNRIILEELRAGRSLVAATIVESRGSTPRKAGTKCLILENGQLIKTIGGGFVEDDVIKKAREIMQEGDPCLMQFDLSNEEAAAAGLICGGHLKIFLEPLRP